MYKHFELLLFWSTIIIIISETTKSGSTTCRPPKLDHCNAPLSGYLTALQKGCSTSRMPLLVSSNLQESMTMLHPFLLASSELSHDVYDFFGIIIHAQYAYTLHSYNYIYHPTIFFFTLLCYLKAYSARSFSVVALRERQQMEKGREQREDKGHSKRERKGQGW